VTKLSVEARIGSVERAAEEFKKLGAETRRRGNEIATRVNRIADEIKTLESERAQLWEAQRLLSVDYKAKEKYLDEQMSLLKDTLLLAEE
jgi:predicted nuclease with TOPRIM domain